VDTDVCFYSNSLGTVISEVIVTRYTGFTYYYNMVMLGYNFTVQIYLKLVMTLLKGVNILRHYK